MRRIVRLAVLFALIAAAPAGAQTPEEVRVPMRDGVELALDIYRPTVEPGQKVPVVLTLTPYHALYKGLGPRISEGYRFLQQGYAFVLADVRGTYESGGCWDYGGVKERQDGYDLVEWLGTQDWSNGRVAMIGNSYDGTTANAAAVERPPHLATIVPISAISRWYGYAYTQGVRHAYSGETADIDPPSDTPADFQFGYGFLPPPEPGAVTAAEQVAMRWNPCDRIEQLLHGYDSEPDFDDFWKARDYLRDAHRIEAPALVAHGLQDYNVKSWEGTQLYEALPGRKAMIVGQWEHASPAWDEWADYLDRWLARWLLGEPNGIDLEPPVISQGADGEFRRRSRWTGTGRVTLPLGDGDVTYTDDGLLTESEMLRGACAGRCAELTLPGLGGAHVIGRPRIRLRATIDRPSTHFVATLVERTAAGSARVISRGFMNARYRQSLESGADVAAGVPQTYELELIDKDHPIAPGSTVELYLASSSTTWVLSDENRAQVTLHLAESTLELPVDGPEPAPPAPIAAAPPAPRPPASSGRRCAHRRAVLRLPRRARGRGRLRVTVDGRRARARRRGRRLTVTLPRTRRGRATVRVRAGRRTVLTRRVRTCRRL